MDTEPLTVGQTAEQAGVTVRTLHHYDEIGLVVPSERSHAGYRLYTAADLQRLARVVLYRRLGIGLPEIAELLDDEEVRGREATIEHLRRQREVVMTRLGELDLLVTAIDHTLEATMSNQRTTPEQLKEIFGDTFDESYQAEAQQRWGDSAQWAESSAKTKDYTPEQWQQSKAEGDAIHERLAALVRAGADPAGAEAMDAVDAMRDHMSRWFYDCSPAMHAQLGELYVSDPRFAAYYDGIAPGLAAFVRDATAANRDRYAARGEAGSGFC